MAEVKKARLFLRRGTDTDRKTTTLCEGELGYSTDAFRVVVGDGTTAGGRSLGTTVFVSAGSLARHFHTKLTEASAGGLAYTGDLAVFPALQYFRADGVTTSTPHASATCVMLLTGSTPADTTSWVSINSGIPWGNLHVQPDDIIGDYISGGDISGDVMFSGTLSTTSMTGTSAFVRGLEGTGNRNVVVTSGGQLSASTDAVAMADGTLKFLGTSIQITANESGSACDWLNYPNPAGVPNTASVGLFQFVWRRTANDTAPTNQILMVRNKPSGSGGVELSACATANITDNTQKGALQIYCPLSGSSGNIGFDFKLFDGASNTSTLIFKAGYNLSLIGYM